MSELWTSFSIKWHMNDFFHYSPLWAYFYFSVGLAQPLGIYFLQINKIFFMHFCCCKGLIFFVDIHFLHNIFVAWHFSCNFSSSSLCPSILTSKLLWKPQKSFVIHRSILCQSQVNFKSFITRLIDNFAITSLCVTQVEEIDLELEDRHRQTPYLTPWRRFEILPNKGRSYLTLLKLLSPPYQRICPPWHPSPAGGILFFVVARIDPSPGQSLLSPNPELEVGWEKLPQSANDLPHCHSYPENELSRVKPLSFQNSGVIIEMWQSLLHVQLTYFFR